MVVDADREIACCFTGHREIPADDMGGIRKHLNREIERLHTENGVTVFYAGGATGFDALASEAVIERRAVHPDIRLVIVMPHKEQARRWGAEEKAQHYPVLGKPGGKGHYRPKDKKHHQKGCGKGWRKPIDRVCGAFIFARS